MCKYSLIKGDFIIWFLQNTFEEKVHEKMMSEMEQKRESIAGESRKTIRLQVLAVHY